MSTNSFQNEIPPARVNIQLSVDKGGAQKKMELPMKVVVLGGFYSKARFKPYSRQRKNKHQCLEF